MNMTSAFERVEKVVCFSIETLFEENISVQDIYNQTTKPHKYIALARYMCFLFLRDNYAMSYKNIARHANMKENSVIHNVAKARILRFTDKNFAKLYSLIKNSI